MKATMSSTDNDLSTTSGTGSRTTLRAISWVSFGFSAIALGLIIGRELRQRYKFSKRTPYDFYAHSGDETPDIEYGVGI
jgi:hypothetical protein